MEPQAKKRVAIKFACDQPRSEDFKEALRDFSVAWFNREGELKGERGATRIIQAFTRHLRAGGGDSLVIHDRADYSALLILETAGFHVNQQFNPSRLYVRGPSSK